MGRVKSPTFYDMKKTIFNPNTISSKDMLEIMYYCKGFIEISKTHPKLKDRVSLNKALDGCIKISSDILLGCLEGQNKKASSVDVNTFVTICYFSYKFIDNIQKLMPEEFKKEVLHDNADEIKEKVRQLVIDINETLYKNDEISKEAYLMMLEQMNEKQNA